MLNTNKRKITIAILLLMIIATISGFIGYLYVQKKSINILGQSIGFQPPVEKICSQFNLEDNFEKNKKVYEDIKNASNFEDKSTYEIMLILLSVNPPGSSSTGDFGNSKYQTFLGLVLLSIWIGDGSDYPIENYQAARAPYIGLYNIKYSKFKNLSKKEFLQSLDCSILKAIETKIMERSDQKWKEYGSSYKIKNYSKYSYFDKKINEDRLVKSQNASESELDGLLAEKSKGYNEFFDSNSFSGSSSQNFSFRKLYEEIPFLTKDADHLKNIGKDAFLKEVENIKKP